jgi:hypothetical protein
MITVPAIIYQALISNEMFVIKLMEISTIITTKMMPKMNPDSKFCCWLLATSFWLLPVSFWLLAQIRLEGVYCVLILPGISCVLLKPFGVP